MELKPLFTYAEDSEREFSPVFPDIEDTKVEIEPLLTDTEDSSNSDTSSSESNPMTTEQKFTLVSLSISYAFSSAFYSMLGPIYPQEAKRKGVSQLMTGLIFGVHALVVFATSPFFGKYLYRIGAKFVLIVGLLVAGISNVIFGFLDDSPDGFVYVVLCLIVRTLEGLGCSAFETAGFAIMAYTFPSRVSTMFGIIEAVIGFGFMVGPVIGGALYQA
ncbi:unnamed protein product [Owenia fusiformis]|uniref:Major facilitator superfamily (MFS) profile domain-containing protein n=1 Tax=Owenia fusiformis TaxID=6347 RepID=A0A8S4PX62_OWEFU|nr:unnamed protein product [Owenia fusiformis]